MNPIMLEESTLPSVLHSRRGRASENMLLKSVMKKKIKFIQSSAIHSVIGYLFGIGDRHPHNILVSNTTHEVIHIDFGICFGQGSLLVQPEHVPFQFTRGMDILSQDLAIMSKGRWRRGKRLFNEL
jgi:hypothetical protein